MKLNRLLVLSLGLSLGFAFAEGADAPDYSHVHWAYGVGVNEETGEVEGWYDADKRRNPDAEERTGLASAADDGLPDARADDPMCYAASASNLIAWWQNSDKAIASAAPTDVDDIWNTYVRNNLDWGTGGTAHAAINWWLSGVYSPVTQTGDAWDWAEENDPVWERFYAAPEQVIERDEEGKSNVILPLTLPNYQKDNEAFGGYYYDQYGLDQEDLSDFMVIVWSHALPEPPEEETASVHKTLTLGDIEVPDYEEGESEDEDGIDYIYELDFVEILKDAPLSLAIFSDSSELGHSITLWGVEYDEEGNLVSVWLTDSDDYTDGDRLFSVSVIMDEAANKLYLDDDPDDGRYFCQEYNADVYIGAIYTIDPTVAATWPVPEPATAALSLLALAALAVRRHRGGC